MCASAILPVMIGSSWVTSVCGSWAPCSNSTSMPARNCSRSKRPQSTPIASPTRRASSLVVRRVSVTSQPPLLGTWSSGLRERVDLLRQVEDLVRDVDQLFVLAVLFFDRLPLLVGDHLTLGVGPVLADHHEG